MATDSERLAQETVTMDDDQVIHIQCGGGKVFSVFNEDLDDEEWADNLAKLRAAFKQFGDTRYSAGLERAAQMCDDRAAQICADANQLALSVITKTRWRRRAQELTEQARAIRREKEKP